MTFRVGDLAPQRMVDIGEAKINSQFVMSLTWTTSESDVQVSILKVKMIDGTLYNIEHLPMRGSNAREIEYKILEAMRIYDQTESRR